jgi:DNA-binding Lrp family transcriptional regulator
MVTAFVLINLQDKNIKKIADNLLQLPGIVEVHAVAGEYDMVAEIKVSDNRALSELITEHIVHAAGVLHTKTLFSLQSFDKK